MSKSIHRTLGITLACSLAIGAALPGFSAQDVTAMVEKASNLMNAGKAKPAAELLREAIRLNPDDAKAHAQLGAALAAQVEKDDYEDAIHEEQQALKLDPKSFVARIILGHIYANMQKSAEAIAILKEAVEVKPTSYGAHRDLGIAYLSAGKADESIAAFKKALEIKSDAKDAADIHCKLAVLLSKKGRTQEAISEANQLVELAPKDAESHVVLGNILLESGDDAGSVEPFKDALKIIKNHPNALSGLGWAQRKEDAAEAVADQQKAIKADPRFLPAYVRLGDLYADQNKTAEAEAQFKTALKLSPNDAGVGTSYAKFLAKTDRKDEAVSALKKVIAKSPQYKPAADALAGLQQPKSK
ncbi:MAG: tetratricopeptide repeat protein [Candidatus Obscuribacterales bacterium]|nr:tetratricopeptide repeat protein [Candidatus Obscuribacterales bacterium]